MTTARLSIGSDRLWPLRWDPGLSFPPEQGASLFASTAGGAYTQDNKVRESSAYRSVVCLPACLPGRGHRLAGQLSGEGWKNWSIMFRDAVGAPSMVISGFFVGGAGRL